ncbi:RimJ/RimL family protein N-acetyltransferase [Kribbella sp. VKM Ac-2571]|uniref:GNAT family N-acetyltransferase n=1 Tax=Kribbella sp. VKM Ac-2571 TaxID=2512222 RepID=UPI00105E2BCF|nr:GNAT family protein [Kribbella sp. VKM Ac-2571]TDO69069.1 RimJ/RimL family protein N-acetyltransferase [Kribbella sp. VKM Ac-2571]
MPALEPHRIDLGDVVLRPFVASDEPAVALALQDPGILRWTAGTAVISSPADKRARRWLEPRIDGWARGNAIFAIADAETDQVIGNVALRDVHRVPDQAVAAYWVSPLARGRRLGARALDAAARWAFTSGLRLHRISLDHSLVNEGSCHVALRAGFQLEGVMRDYYVEVTGQRHDSHLHARLATDPAPYLGTQPAGS